MIKSDAGQVESMRLIFNYNSVFCNFYYDDLGGCIYRSREYAISYMYSGEMIFDNEKEQIHMRKGEYVFIPRDHHMTVYKETYNDERCCGIFLMFTHRFLRGMYSRLGQREVPVDTPELNSDVIEPPQTVELASLFASMTPYFNPEIKPRDDFTNLKIQEGLLALLDIDERLAPTLFDFNKPWKMDILEFMSENYMYEFTMGEVARYTEHSLATFKRDFKKISDLTPEKWLTHKHLEVVYNEVREDGGKVVDVCAEVGFKNPSHFSTAFKKQYGISLAAMIA